MRWIFRVVRVLLLTVFFAVAMLLASLWIEHRTNVALPKPTGLFAVGRVLYDWVDSATVDPLAPAAATKRELLVWIWYPSEQGETDDYIPASVQPPGGRRGAPIFRWLTRDLSKVHGHSLRNAGVSTKEQAYPVIIMRAGASSEVMNYSTLAEDLASHGYIVVGFDAPYRTNQVVFPDGRMMERSPANNPELFSGEALDRVANKLLAAWTGDIGFALNRLNELNVESDKFKGRLDLDRVGVFGHSLGGATAAQFCAQDTRCKAGIDIDGMLIGPVIRTGIRKPFMFLLSGLGDFSSDAETRQFMSDIHGVYDRLAPGERLLISIRGANHFTFSDDGAVLKSYVFRGALRLFGRLKIDGRRQLAITAYYVRSFFDAHLKGGAPLNPQAYPEIQVLK